MEPSPIKEETDHETPSSPMEIDSCPVAATSPEPSKILETESNGTLEITEKSPLLTPKSLLQNQTFDLQRYKEMTSSVAAQHPLLFSYHRVATMKVFNAVYTVDMSIRVISGEHVDKEGIIKGVNYPTLTIETKDLKMIVVEYTETRLIFDGYQIHFWLRFVSASSFCIFKRIIKI